MHFVRHGASRKGIRRYRDSLARWQCRCRARSRRPCPLSVRARGLDRAACDLLAGRCAAAAARRALAGRLLCASHLWRNGPLLATCSCAGCWLVLVPRRHGLLDRDVRDPVQLDHRARLHLQVGGSLLAQPARGLAAPAGVACSASGFGRLQLHVENGLLKIFRSVCGSSTPASSCQDERRRQTSCAAAAVLLTEWRARGSC